MSSVSSLSCSPLDVAPPLITTWRETLHLEAFFTLYTLLYKTFCPKEKNCIFTYQISQVLSFLKWNSWQVRCTSDHTCFWWRNVPCVLQSEAAWMGVSWRRPEMQHPKELQGVGPSTASRDKGGLAKRTKLQFLSGWEAFWAALVEIPSQVTPDNNLLLCPYREEMCQLEQFMHCCYPNLLTYISHCS